MDRRKFISRATLSTAALVTGVTAQEKQPSTSRTTMVEKLAGPRRAVIISKNTGIQSSERSYALLTGPNDPLDAVLEMMRTQEDDPNDESVGLGGLPNEEGQVELDACVMHGPTRRAGAVGGVRKIKNVSKVARLVMERSNHVFLVGEGAQRFATAHGFPKEDLLTDHARRTWLLWKETMSDKDNWGPGISDPDWKLPAPAPSDKPEMQSESLHERTRRLYEIAGDLGIEPERRMQAVRNVLFPPTGTIHVSAVNAKGEMVAGTTTSGLAWKLVGRVGDSPIIGAGCFCDQDIGSAGATGTGEENIKIVGGHTIVENMRKGMSPHDAGMDALQRISRNHNHDTKKLRFLEMVFYVLRRDGMYAGVSLWSHTPSGHRTQFQVNDGKARLEDCAYLYEGKAIDWPPYPEPPAK